MSGKTYRWNTSADSGEHYFLTLLKDIRGVFISDELEPKELERKRRQQNTIGHIIAPMAGLVWEKSAVGNMEVARTIPEWEYGPSPVVLYCHGGGYTSGNLGYARILSAKLARAGGCEVISFEYRLAPEHPFPAAVEDSVSMWDWLLEQGRDPNDIVLAGDSAGGNLALVLAQSLLAQGRPLPRAIVLLSPWTDMTMSGQSYAQEGEQDPVISSNYVRAVRRVYAGERDLSDPSLSPLFGPMAGLPPVLIQVGEHEVLRSDSVRLRDRMLRAGVRCTLEVWRGQWHDFQMFPSKTAHAAMERIGRFLRTLT